MNRQNKLIVFEPNMNSFPHSEVNAGFLSLVESIYIKEELVFIADKNHINAISQIKSISKWHTISSKVFSYTPSFFIFNDIFLIYKSIKLLYSYKKTDTIYYLGIMPLAHIFISLFNVFTKRNINICLHGQMESYLKDTKIGLSKYYYRLSKFVFMRNEGITYIIFGQSIKKSLMHLFHKSKKIIVIDQPYIYNRTVKNHSLIDKEVINFGFLGRFDSSKNVVEFFYFVDSLAQLILENKINIKIVGKIDFDIPSKYLNLITFYSRSLTNEEFKKEVLLLDFVINFTDENYYKATPSGVFFDCIKWEIPILSLNNNFISYYFSIYPNIGKNFRLTNEMISYVKLIINNQALKKANYLEFVKNIRNIKISLSIKKLKEDFYRQL